MFHLKCLAEIAKNKHTLAFSMPAFMCWNQTYYQNNEGMIVKQITPTSMTQRM